MKIRQGFVSNSSSTSFCIYGVRTDNTELFEDEDLWFKARAVGLLAHPHFDSCCSFIGREFKTLEDHETGADFKKTTREKLATFLGRPVEESECEIHDECWGG